jgi:HK97 family phage prohead protease
MTATMLEARTKTLLGTLKAIPSDGSRMGSAIVYVYGAADEDPILDELFALRNDLKLRWAHGIAPEDIIGKITAVRFLETQVEIDFQLFETAKGDEVYELMLLGGVTEFSVGFAFQEKDVYKGEDERWHVKRAELTEVSAVPSGANRETMLTAIKAIDAKAGRTISAKNEASLRQVRDIIDGILSSLGPAEEAATPEEKTPEDEGIKHRDELVQRIRLLTMETV